MPPCTPRPPPPPGLPRGSVPALGSAAQQAQQRQQVQRRTQHLVLRQPSPHLQQQQRQHLRPRAHRCQISDTFSFGYVLPSFCYFRFQLLSVTHLRQRPQRRTLRVRLWARLRLRRQKEEAQRRAVLRMQTLLPGPPS
jgi:hypothetical protein